MKVMDFLLTPKEMLIQIGISIIGMLCAIVSVLGSGWIISICTGEPFDLIAGISFALVLAIVVFVVAFITSCIYTSKSKKLIEEESNNV